MERILLTQRMKMIGKVLKPSLTQRALTTITTKEDA